MTLTLRPYQQEALDAIYHHLRHRDDNPCAVLATGAGKTPLLAKICQDAVEAWGGRVLVLAHVKELLEQAAKHLASYLPVNMVGLHSAGLGRRDTEHPVIVAGIQSVFEKAGELGAFNVIIVDECHLIPESGEGRYRSFLADAKIVNPNVRFIGLTATPFRLGTGMLCKPENLLNHVCYETNVKELILQGYLSPLRTKRGMECADLSQVKVMSTGEYSSDEMQIAFETVIKPACEEILALTMDRHSVLVFSAGVEHAHMVASLLGGEVITGKTDKTSRADIISRFRQGLIKYLVNVDVLTTGFDAPNVDTVVLLRATMSPGLYYQMLGRGLRKHESKTDCLILDYGDNAIRHGPIDQIVVHDKGKRGSVEVAPGKECPKCHDVIAVQCVICPTCEYEFPRDLTPNHSDRAGDAPVMSGEPEITVRQIYGINYRENKKVKPDGPSVTLRVEYVVNEFTNQRVNEFVCLNHTPGSFAHNRAVEWWKKRSNAPVPPTVMDALAVINKGALADTIAITIKQEPGKKYSEIIDHELGDIPFWEFVDETDEDFFETAPVAGMRNEDIPF